MRNRIVALALSIGTLFLSQALMPNTASACSCGPDYSSPKRQLEKADTVFVAKVVEVRQERRPSSQGGSFTAHINVLEVESRWKGVTASTVTIVVATDYEDSNGRRTYTSCDRDNIFMIGARYLVYAYENDDGTYGVSLACGRTRLVGNADEDLKVLGKPISLAYQPNMPATGVSEHDLTLLAAIMTLILGIGFVLTSPTFRVKR